MTVIEFAIVAGVVWAVVNAQIAYSINPRFLAGFLGFLYGPIGILIACVMPCIEGVSDGVDRQGQGLGETAVPHRRKLHKHKRLPGSPKRSKDSPWQ